MTSHLTQEEIMLLPVADWFQINHEPGVRLDKFLVYKEGEIYARMPDFRFNALDIYLNQIPNRVADQISTGVVEAAGKPRALGEAISYPVLEDGEKKLSKLLGVMQECRLSLVRDQFNECFLILDDDPTSLINLDSPQFVEWIQSLSLEAGNMAVDLAVKAVKMFLRHQCAKLPRVPLETRVAEDAQGIWYDLGSGKYVRTTQDGWSIQNANLPLLLKRCPQQSEQCSPVAGGDVRAILSFVNIVDGDQQLLFLVFLVSCFIPNFPHPVLMLHGAQGSAKSTLSKIVKNLVDPSQLETTTIHSESEIKDFVQTASHHWLTVLDNLSYITEKVSDTLARICTGGGLSKRRHYTNDDDFIYNFMHIMVLNGISQVIKRADLLDRALLIKLDRIDQSKRMTERELWHDYTLNKPSILGGIFSVLSKSLSMYDRVEAKNLPRMADFAKWGCAIAVALGYTEQAFISAYARNIDIQNDEAIEASVVATVLIRFMANNSYSYIEITPTDLFTKLFVLAEEMKLSFSTGWPKSPSLLSRNLGEIEPNLLTQGIRVGHIKRKERLIAIRRVNLEGESSSPPDAEKVDKKIFDTGAKDDTDGRDATLPTL
jgi:hypothetical protein